MGFEIKFAIPAVYCIYSYFPKQSCWGRRLSAFHYNNSTVKRRCYSKYPWSLYAKSLWTFPIANSFFKYFMPALTQFRILFGKDLCPIMLADGFTLRWSTRVRLKDDSTFVLSEPIMTNSWCRTQTIIWKCGDLVMSFFDRSGVSTEAWTIEWIYAMSSCI